jgi:SAM-dependent methyltransferase
MQSGKNSEFDTFATGYDEALNQGLKYSGEAKEYFADGRVRWLREKLGPSLKKDARCLDYGCGTGTAAPFLLEHLGLSRVVGVDLSEESLEIARAQNSSATTEFHPLQALDGMEGQFDLAYCNGVFHHIPIAERAACMSAVFRALKPGGWFGFWENNPWNPMVHFMMSRVPFDKDAIMLWPRESRERLRKAGFVVKRTDFMFVFPGALAGLRRFEPALCALPLGGQYQILCQKPLA